MAITLFCAQRCRNININFLFAFTDSESWEIQVLNVVMTAGPESSKQQAASETLMES